MRLSNKKRGNIYVACGLFIKVPIYGELKLFLLTYGDPVFCTLSHNHIL